MERFFVRMPTVDLPTIRRQWLPTAGAYVRDVYTAPFRVDSTQEPGRSADIQDRDRRTAVLRMILLSTAVLLLAVALPVGLVLRLSGDSLGVLALVGVLGAIALVVCDQGHALLAGIIYVAGGMALGTSYPFIHASGIDTAVVNGYTGVTLFILIAMLVLPAIAAWVLTVATWGATVAALISVPLAPSLQGAASDGARRTTLLGQIVVAQVLTALLGWISVRSARAAARAAEAAARREREVATLRERFLVEVNHELRTPIMIWYGNTELLDHMGERATPEDRAHMLARAMQAGNEVLLMLQHMLDVSYLESEVIQLHAAALPLRTVVSNALANFKGPEMAKDVERPVTIQIAPELQAWADPERVEQVLRHLISNALKYSPPGSLLEFMAQPAFGQQRRVFGGWSRGIAPDLVQIGVRDYGVGVPPADQGKLFNRFVRLDRDTTGSIRGMGIGLYQCRLLVNAMGGQIWLASDGVPGRGTLVAFTLPAAPTGASLVAE
jgi:signal transduction histidine kinase